MEPSKLKGMHRKANKYIAHLHIKIKGLVVTLALHTKCTLGLMVWTGALSPPPRIQFRALFLASAQFRNTIFRSTKSTFDRNSALISTKLVSENMMSVLQLYSTSSSHPRQIFKLGGHILGLISESKEAFLELVVFFCRGVTILKLTRHFAESIPNCMMSELLPSPEAIQKHLTPADFNPWMPS